MAGIYLHIPYTDAGTLQRADATNYVHALKRELDYYARTHANNETIEAIYFGGCTHAFTAADLRDVLEGLLAQFDTVTLQEISVEVTPGLMPKDLFAEFLTLGVTRVQVLAGSFFDDDLHQLGVSFSSKALHDTMDEVRAAGIEKTGIDLCLNVPDQPLEYWGANLEKIAHWKIDHVSMYRHAEGVYWPAPHHRYYGCPPLSPAEKERLELAMSYLPARNYDQYLWMEFARSRAESALSQLYVQHANILGAGSGAHSFWWHGSSQSRAARWANIQGVQRYTALLMQNELPIDLKSWFDLDALADEYIMLQLQSSEGLQIQRLESEYGVDLLTEKIDELAALEAAEWIEPIRNNRVRLTRSGKLNYPLVFRQLLLET